MNINKDISVVLGTYNRKKFLKLTIESVREELENSNLKYEIIVIDGGSTDGTIKWLTKQKDIISIIQHNRGVWQGEKIEQRSWGYFMNLGFKCAQGKYICMLSDDCLLIPGAIINGFYQFEEALKIGVKIGGIAFFYRDLPNDNKYKIHRILSNKLNINHGLYFTEALEKVGYIEETSYKFYAGDSDLSLKLDYSGYQIIAAENSYIEHFHNVKYFLHTQKKEAKNNIKLMSEDTAVFEKKWIDKYPKINSSPIHKYYIDATNTMKRFRKAIPVTYLFKKNIFLFLRIYLSLFSDMKSIIKYIFYFVFKQDSIMANKRINQSFVKWFKYLQKQQQHSTVKKSNIEIDVAIPIHRKDLNILPLCLRSIKENIKHPINKVFIIAAKEKIIIDFCKNNNCIFLDENQLLPLKKNEIKCSKKGKDLSGWLFQQILKYAVCNFVEKENILVADADTLFVSKQVFIDNKSRVIMDISEQYFIRYFKMYKKLFGYNSSIPLSFIAHHMLINKKVLYEMLAEIEKKHNCKWYKYVIKNTIPDEDIIFSEYETYGNYFFKHYRKGMVLRDWRNKDLYNIDTDYEKLLSSYSNNYLSVSMQHYNRKFKQ